MLIVNMETLISVQCLLSLVGRPDTASAGVPWQC